MSSPFLGQIMMVGFNFPPRGWAFCDGALLAISSNTALFSLLGTTFGGDGRTTFGLPDLRGRVAIHPGNGPGLASVTWGERGGANNVTLTINQIPSHTHLVGATTDPADDDSPQGRIPAVSRQDAYAHPNKRDTTLRNPDNQGGSQSHTNMQPFLGIYHCIALTGVYPSRS